MFGIEYLFAPGAPASFIVRVAGEDVGQQSPTDPEGAGGIVHPDRFDVPVGGHGQLSTSWILSPSHSASVVAQLLPMALYRGPSGAGLPRHGIAV